MLNETSSSDEQIVKDVLNGDIEIFRVIVRRYRNYIYSIGMRFFKNEEDSNDFVQDIFLKVYNELKSYKGKSSFRAWMVRIAYNYGINKIKAKKIERVIYEESLSREPDPENKIGQIETVDILRKAINSLPENYRICVDLYFFMGLKYTEIEKITGFPLNTIKSNVLRAKQILRDELRGSIAEDYHEM